MPFREKMTHLIHGIGKMTVLKCRHQLDCESLVQFGEDNNYAATEELLRNRSKKVVDGVVWWTDVLVIGSTTCTPVAQWKVKRTEMSATYLRMHLISSTCYDHVGYSSAE